MGKIYCTECGAELNDTVKFCSSCGNPVDNNKMTDFNNVIVNDKSSNDDSVEIKEKSTKTINKKYIIVTIIAIIIIAILGFVIVTVTSPLYSAGYTVDTSDYSIYSDQVSYPTFDNEFAGSNVNFYDTEDNGEIDVWHHNAHGHDVDYYLKQYGTYDKDTSGNPYFSIYNVDYGLKIKNISDITVDGVK